MEEAKKRDEKGRIVYDPGPGRPKRIEWLRMRIHEMDSDNLDRLEQIAKHGKDTDSISAIRLMWSYGHGNPPQVITGEDGSPVGGIVGSDIVDIIRRLASERKSP